MLEQEITILKQVNHANIIHLQQVYDTTRVSAAANAKPSAKRDARLAIGYPSLHRYC